MRYAARVRGVFFLDVETDEAARSASLRLTDEHGAHLGFHEVKLAAHGASDWEGVFDTRAHVRRMQSEARPAARLLAQVGEFLATSVLGPEIMAALEKDWIRSRTLVVRLPDTAGDRLAAAFARVPWEIARRPGEEHTLLQRAVVVRAVAAGMEGSNGAPGEERVIAPERDKALRVLLVFAEAPGSRPLAARLERERLLDLFFGEVMPDKHVEVDVLCHGVTRRRLEERIKERGGYHVVHWSGHGHHDLLAIGLDDGEAADKKRIPGAELVDLFRRAGGFIPDLFFLSACLSGSLVSAKDWESLRAAMRDPEAAAGDVAPSLSKEGGPALDKVIADARGYTGTALQLLRAGVPQVVAMRYEVGDPYARRLARRFYRRLFADRDGKPVDGALGLARSDLIEDPRASEHHPVDHATPLLFGAGSLRFAPKARRSPQADRRDPRPQPLLAGFRDLDRPHNFVGRGAELTLLATGWLEHGRQRHPGGGPVVALIQGLAGLGKTALAAEATHLWHPRFDHVLAFTGRGANLPVEELHRLLDQKLRLRSKVYRDRCAEDEMAPVYVAPTRDFTGEVRRRHLCENLTAALRAERCLLVLDNLDTILRPSPRADGTYDAQDPEWDRVLATLADGLQRSGSRVLVTSRHKPAALAGESCITFALGPLPRGEAVTFFQGHEALRKLAFSEAASDRELAERVLRVSHGHPLILKLLAGVAQAAAASGGAPPSAALAKALDRLQGEGFKTLPDLVGGETAVAVAAVKEQERRYLEDVAIGAVDLLIERLSREARQLLWIVTRAFEGVGETMLRGVWGERSLEDEQIAQLAGMLDHIDRMPPPIQERLRNTPPPMLAAIEAWKARGGATERAPMEPRLAELLHAGLVHRGGESGPLTFHELVTERATEWMKEHPGDRWPHDEYDVWTNYGERYGALFRKLQRARKPGSRDAAVEMGKRGIRYLARAREFDKLGAFAGAVVTSMSEPTLLGEVIGELRAVAERVPAGKARWRLRASLADALQGASQPDQALGLYTLAAEEAEAAGQWGDVGWICHNWANALSGVGDLAAARATYQRCAEAHRRAGHPRVFVLASELEALRVDVDCGAATAALPAIEVAVTEVRGWWIRHQAGDKVPEAPDNEALARTLVSGLDLAQQAYRVLERWTACLEGLDELEQVERSLGTGTHETARTRFNKYGPLMRLGRLAEAKQVLEECLEVDRHAGDITGEATTLSALADVWDELGDVRQAIALERQALATRERLPDPWNRSISHGNLASYLHRTGHTAEAKDHQLSDLAYSLVTGLDPRISLRNLALRVREAATRGETFTLPRLADLLTSPAFATLRDWLSSRAVSLEDLQTRLDEVFEEARTAALAPTPPPAGGSPPEDGGVT